MSWLLGSLLPRNIPENWVGFCKGRLHIQCTPTGTKTLGSAMMLLLIGTGWNSISLWTHHCTYSVYVWLNYKLSSFTNLKIAIYCGHSRMIPPPPFQWHHSVVIIIHPYIKVYIYIISLSLSLSIAFRPNLPQPNSGARHPSIYIDR